MGRSLCFFGQNAGVLRFSQNDSVIFCRGRKGLVCFEGFEQAVERSAEEEGEQDFGDEVAGEEKDAGGGQGGETRIEGGAGAEGLFRPAVAEKSEKENADGLGQMGGEGVEAEEAEAKGDEPVGEWCFFEIADAVDMEGDEVAGEGHVAGGVGVGGVSVVEQRWGEERGEEDDQPEAAEDQQSGGATRGAGVKHCRAFRARFGEGLIDHEVPGALSA